MQQLLSAYKRREIDRYAEVLSRDFVFRFQEKDIDLLGPELVFGQDSLSTRTLFHSPDVVDVRLSMTWLPPTEELWEGEPALRVVLSDLLLEVEQSNNVTLRVQGQTQHFYFRPGKTGLGEDPDRYYLRAWRDIGSGGGTGLGAAVENETWGAIKARFALPPLDPADVADPEGLLSQLKVAYDTRDPARYRALLSHDFEFHYYELNQGPVFVADRQEEVRGTDYLFASHGVESVSLDLVPVLITEELWDNEPMIRVVVNDPLVRVVETGGNVVETMETIHHFYMDTGRPTAGEDPDRYYLRAWREIAAGGLGAAVDRITWWEIKHRYAP